MKILIRLGIALGFSFLLFACGSKGNGGGSIARIEITPQQANVTPGQTLQFSAVAKNSSGNTVDNVTFSWRSADASIATIDANGLATGQAMGVTSIVASAGTFSGSAPIGVVSTAPGSPNITVSGKAEYEDRPFDLSGFTGQRVPAAIRGAIVNVIAIDGFVTLASHSTGPDGSFTFSANEINNASRRAGLYLQVLSKTDLSNPIQVEIRSTPDDRALFALVSSALDDSTSASFSNLQLLASASGIGGAFNILDVFSQANDLVRSAGPCNTVSNPSTSPCVPPPLTAYWEPGSATGTFFDSQQDAIFILGGGTSDGDTDEYDDSVIAHEYGHFVVAHFSHDNSPGGIHFITDNKQDIRLSFSEGWGNFFSSAVRNSPLYVDTAAQGSFSFELEGLTSSEIQDLPTIAIYDTHELSDAKVLWDIFDASPPTADDPLQLGFLPIWQTMIQIPAASPATMESFWLTFKTVTVNPTDASGLQAILQGRQIFFVPDQYETGGEVPLTPNAPAQHHTLYKSDADPTDEDVIPLNNLTQGTQYTVETFNLTNAADTFLSIFDNASGTPIAGLQNDNRNGQNYQNCDTGQGVGDSGQSNSSCPPNDKTPLSSSISFKATSATLSAHVKHSPNAPPSAGLFGSYDIHLKGP